MIVRDYILSRKALGDFKEIRDYLIVRNPKAAKETLEGIRKTIIHLCHFPHSGVIKGEILPRPNRFFISGNYFIIYDSDSNPLKIKRIFRTERDIKSLL